MEPMDLSVENFPHTDKNAKLLVKALKELGYKEIDVNNGVWEEGVEVLQSTSKDGKRQTTNSAYLKPVRSSRANLNIITGAEVLIDENMTVFGVEYTRNGNKEQVRASKEVVLSAGVFRSPHILMLSGIGPEDMLKMAGVTVIKNLNVGQNFKNHISTKAVGILINKEPSQIPTSLSQCQDDAIQYVYSGSLSSMGINVVSAFKKSKYAPEHDSTPDIQYHFYPHVFNIKYGVDSDDNTSCEDNNAVLLPWCYYNGFFATPVILKPKFVGCISLNITQPTENLIINDNMLTKSGDLKVLLEEVLYFKNLTKTEEFSQAGFTSVPQLPPECSSEIFDSDSYWRCLTQLYAYPFHHGRCTCKMGPDSDNTSVVNSRLEVHGIKKLRVIDASVMPELPSGNTMEPVIMIPERGSDMIKEKWLK